MSSQEALSVDNNGLYRPLAMLLTASLRDFLFCCWSSISSTQILTSCSLVLWEDWDDIVRVSSGGSDEGSVISWLPSRPWSVRRKFCQQLVYKIGYMKTHKQRRKESRKRKENRLVSLSLNTLSYNSKYSVLQKGGCFCKCFPVWSHKKYLLQKQNSLPETQKRFLTFSDIFCFHRKFFSF